MLRLGVSTEHNSTDELTGKTVQYLLLDLGYKNEINTNLFSIVLFK